MSKYFLIVLTPELIISTSHLECDILMAEIGKRRFQASEMTKLQTSEGPYQLCLTVEEPENWIGRADLFRVNVLYTKSYVTYKGSSSKKV